MAACSGSGSQRMSQRANRPRCHGCTVCIAQPPRHASAAQASNKYSMLLDERRNFVFESIDVPGLEANVAITHDAVAIDQIRRRHALQSERLRDVPLRV